MGTKTLKSRLILAVGAALISVGFVSTESLDVSPTATKKAVHIEAGLVANLETEILQLSRLTGLTLEEMLQDMLNNEQQQDVVQTK